ncbi:hypothetical protein [Streptomyces ipomoeae]|uniref:hypothetical protein n=1 Tax=Streptomyces ipomoeae TaxID=103232 RepID=UPI0011470C10|nr:hypothetical protein [Streptomyces ipomoeae]MDX2935984.1 hypothetical protein [Streptomyces ipomoeae]TQE14755.1 hypothetical protein SipoB123_45915 [Streptomyces ipomoeae]
MSKRLLYKGLPVPYIAAWSGERLPQPPVVLAKDGIAFADAVAANGNAEGRDQAGALWQRWALRRGDGVPEFNAVHGPRQRQAMRKLLCQVCGGPSDKNEQGRLWLLEDYRGVEGWPEREVTTHPPVCRACAPVAARRCPHLKNKVVAVRAGQVALDGVYGKVYSRGTGPLPVLDETTTVFARDWRVRWMVGAQLAATLMDVTIVDLPRAGIEPAGRTAPGRVDSVA